MSRIAYVQGRYVPHHKAFTHIEDRGYQFADGIYEVICVMDSVLLDFSPHMDRLDRSLQALRIPQPLTRQAFTLVCQEIIRQNRFQNGLIYIQVSRGISPRKHEFSPRLKPVVVVTARHVDHVKFLQDKSAGVKVISLQDTRWKRPDIKSVSLLPNILGKQQALDNKAYEAVLLDEKGHVTEANAMNVWIVNEKGQLQTHPATDHKILDGITRLRLLDLAKQQGIPILEVPFTLSEMVSAKEAFLSASVAGIVPVIQVDEHTIGDGKPGFITHKLQTAYLTWALEHHDR